MDAMVLVQMDRTMDYDILRKWRVGDEVIWYRDLRSLSLAAR